MPANVKKTADFEDKEVLKFPTGLHAIPSIVLDATDFAVPDDGTRFRVPAGTILRLSTTNSKQYVEYKGGGAGIIKGILAHGVDLVARATNANEAAPMFYHECVFATTAIVGFTQHASALVADLKTCKFE